MTEEEYLELKKINGHLRDIKRELEMSDLYKNDHHTYSKCMRSVRDIEPIIKKLFGM